MSLVRDLREGLGSILQQFVRVRRVFASSSNAQGFFKRPSPRTRWPPPVGSARDRARDRARDARTPRGVQHGRPPPPGAKGRHAASPRRLATGTDRPCCPSLLRRRSLHETPRARVLKPSHGAQYYKVGPRRTKRTPRKSCDCTSRPTHLRLCDLFPHLLQEWTARGTRCRLFVCVGAAHRGGARPARTCL